MANTRDAKIAYFKSSELESEACLSLPLPVHNVQKRESKVSFLLHKHYRAYKKTLHFTFHLGCHSKSTLGSSQASMHLEP